MHNFSKLTLISAKRPHFELFHCEICQNPVTYGPNFELLSHFLIQYAPVCLKILFTQLRESSHLSFLSSIRRSQAYLVSETCVLMKRKPPGLTNVLNYSMIVLRCSGSKYTIIPTIIMRSKPSSNLLLRALTSLLQSPVNFSQ